MGTIFVDNLEPQSGTSLTLGASGDTLTIPSGCTLNVAGTPGTGFTGRLIQTVQATDASSLSSSSTSPCIN